MTDIRDALDLRPQDSGPAGPSPGWIAKIRRSAIARHLLQIRSEPPETPWGVIRWWEFRRLHFNLLVGTTGLCTLAAMFLTAVISELLIKEPIGWPDGLGIILIPVGIMGYGVAANVCYTAGWVVELIVRNWSAARASRFAVVSFYAGMFFSFLLTLMPAIFTAIVASLTIYGRLTGKLPPPEEP